MSAHAHVDESGTNRAWLAGVVVLAALAIAMGVGVAAPHARSSPQAGPQGLVVLEPNPEVVVMNGIVLERGPDVVVLRPTGSGGWTKEVFSRESVQWLNVEGEELPEGLPVGVVVVEDRHKVGHQVFGTILEGAQQVVVFNDRGRKIKTYPRDRVRWIETHTTDLTQGEYHRRFPKGEGFDLLKTIREDDPIDEETVVAPEPVGEPTTPRPAAEPEPVAERPDTIEERQQVRRENRFILLAETEEGEAAWDRAFRYWLKACEQDQFDVQWCVDALRGSGERWAWTTPLEQLHVVVGEVSTLYETSRVRPEGLQSAAAAVFSVAIERSYRAGTQEGLQSAEFYAQQLRDLGDRYELEGKRWEKRVAEKLR